MDANTINLILLSVVGIIYIGVCLTYLPMSRYGMSLAFFGYSLAQIGFVYDVLTTQVK